jgi:flagellar assembly protein FliH
MPAPAPAVRAVEAAEAAPPPAPTFSEEELAAARQEAQAQGRAAGEAMAKASIEQDAAAALAMLAGALPDLARRVDDGLARNARLMLETSVAGLRRVMPELGRRGGLAEIEGLLQQTVAQLKDESRIMVRLNDRVLDGLRARLEKVAQAAGFEGRFVLLADEEIAVGDCRIEWADGGVERVATRIWADVEAAVERALAAGPRPGDDEASLSISTGANEPQET